MHVLRCESLCSKLLELPLLLLNALTQGNNMRFTQPLDLEINTQEYSVNQITSDLYFVKLTRNTLYVHLEAQSRRAESIHLLRSPFVTVSLRRAASKTRPAARAHGGKGKKTQPRVESGLPKSRINVVTIKEQAFVEKGSWGLSPKHESTG